MSRIGRAYVNVFESLLRRFGARRPEQGVRWLLAKAEQASGGQPELRAKALAQLAESLARKLRQRRQAGPADAAPKVFWCDGGLGGLARWLRAAGYQALWQPRISDADLLRESAKLGAVILTTDSFLLERRVVRNGAVPVFWLPPTLKLSEQLALVFRHFELQVGEPRCMRCGGQLLPVEKEAVRERIPPRTYRWLDLYFACGSCQQLFWQGTHWQRISSRLQLHAATPAGCS
jgi:uncharacterized protein with PIN domain